MVSACRNFCLQNAYGNFWGNLIDIFSLAQRKTDPWFTTVCLKYHWISLRNITFIFFYTKVIFSNTFLSKNGFFSREFLSILDQCLELRWRYPLFEEDSLLDQVDLSFTSSSMFAVWNKGLFNNLFSVVFTYFKTPCKRSAEGKPGDRKLHSRGSLHACGRDCIFWLRRCHPRWGLVAGCGWWKAEIA